MNSGAIKKVASVQTYQDVQSKSTALVADTSTSIATLLGVAVSTSAKGAKVWCSAVLHYNPVGAATTGNAIIPANTLYRINGNKTVLDAVRFIGASGQTPTVNVIIEAEV